MYAVMHERYHMFTIMSWLGKWKLFNAYSDLFGIYTSFCHETPHMMENLCEVTFCRFYSPNLMKVGIIVSPCSALIFMIVTSLCYLLFVTFMSRRV
jgi:hypothetical protein